MRQSKLQLERWRSIHSSSPAWLLRCCAATRLLPASFTWWHSLINNAAALLIFEACLKLNVFRVWTEKEERGPQQLAEGNRNDLWLAQFSIWLARATPKRAEVLKVLGKCWMWKLPPEISCRVCWERAAKCGTAQTVPVLPSVELILPLVLLFSLKV